MNSMVFLADLLQEGAMLWIENGKLLCRTRQGTLLPSQRAELSNRKADILTYLDENKKCSIVSFAQERLWFLDQLVPNNPFYNIAAAVLLHGWLNSTVLAESINESVRRHEAFRTTFASIEGRPIQVIAHTAELTLSVVDLSGFDQMAQEKEQRRLTTEQSQRPFDLTRGPLLRATLIRKEEQVHVLLLTIHHIICDGWSFGVLMRELATLYDVFSAGMPSPLSQLSIQYADFAIWQREWLQGRVLEEQLAYWKRNLTGMPTILALPTDRPRPPVQTYRGATFSFFLPLALGEHLKALCQREEATLFMGLLAAWQTLLYRYSSQENFAVGSPIANRSRPELEGLIGFFANTLVLRADLSGNPTFRELVHRTREVCLGAYAYQDVPFEKLVEELRPERDASHSPLFQVMFVLQNAPRPVVELPGLTLTPLEVETGTTRFDLTLTVTETRQGLKGSLEYNTDLYDGVTIERMGEHFQVLLESVVADAEQRISDLPLLREDERRLVLEEWAHGPREAVPRVCLHELFESQVERTPEAVAVVFEDKAVTYRELNHRANQLAQYLLQLGVGPDVLVGICVERSVEMVVGLLGILKAGGAYVPLDPAYPKERLAFMLADSNASVLLTEERWLERFPKHRAQVVCLDRDWLTIAARSPDKPPSHVCPDNLAYVIYTSGSTGKPKGTLIDHRGVCNHMSWMRETFGLGKTDRVLQKTPISFDASVWEFYMPIIVGAQLVLARPGVLQDGISLVRAIMEHEITILQLVPTLLEILLEERDLVQCKSLRHVFCGGDALQTGPVRCLGERLVTHICNLYGPTEATIDATFHVSDGLIQRATVPIGRPIHNVQAYVLDARMQPVPIGVPGELHLGGVGLARGYLNHPDLTAERFIPNPFTNQTGARLYKTGDLARYLSDGNIEFLGRLDDQIKLRGYRIELGEIEAVLKGHELIQETAVLVGEGKASDKRIVAYVVSSPGQSPRATELSNYLRMKLPEYMIPTNFVFLEKLPLTPNGKVDRNSLPAPDGIRPEVTAYVSPRTPLEEEVARIFGKVLGIDRVGIHDDFFDLGGHSILVARLVAEIFATFKLRLPLRTLFVITTVVNLASLLERTQRAAVKQGISDEQDTQNFLECILDEQLDIVLTHTESSLDPSITPTWRASADKSDTFHDLSAPE